MWYKTVSKAVGSSRFSSQTIEQFLLARSQNFSKYRQHAFDFKCLGFLYTINSIIYCYDLLSARTRILGNQNQSITVIDQSTKLNKLACAASFMFDPSLRENTGSAACSTNNDSNVC